MVTSIKLKNSFLDLYNKNMCLPVCCSWKYQYLMEQAKKEKAFPANFLDYSINISLNASQCFGFEALLNA